MTIRTPSSADMNVCPNSEQGRAPDALCALVRLLARHAAEEAIERAGAAQLVCAKNLPTDTGALNDV